MEARGVSSSIGASARKFTTLHNFRRRAQLLPLAATASALRSFKCAYAP